MEKLRGSLAPLFIGAGFVRIMAKLREERGSTPQS
jgi:hypothetical protein